MATTITDNPPGLARLRLFQLISPSLPVGGFSYSQAIEWAVEQGWVSDEASLQAWLADQLQHTLVAVDLAVLLRLLAAVEQNDRIALSRWCDWLLANRETRELRDEERNRGRALASLLVELELPRATSWRALIARSQLAGFALAAAEWHITARDLLDGYAWSWLENLALAGVKLVPLGQSAGQRILHNLSRQMPDAVECALALPGDAMGASLPALAIASSRHETQYTRLFRS